LDPARIPGVAGDERAAEMIERAIRDEIAEPLGISVDQAALAIVTVANHTLAAAIRLVSIERGVDPRELALLSFGGAAPLHAVAWARELAIPTVLIPLRPGVTSALGCLLADTEEELVRSYPVAVDELDMADLVHTVEALSDLGRNTIEAQRIDCDRVSRRIT